MRQVIDRLSSNPKNERFFSWVKLISITGSAQVIIQAVAFICGILVIRLLPTQQYALYILANTMLGTMTTLADGGISTGVMSQSAKVWRDKNKLGIVLSTGLYLRRKFAFYSLLFCLPLLFYLLILNGANTFTAVLIGITLIPAFYAALSDSLLEIIPKLHQSIWPLQKNEVVVGIGRLGLSAITLFVFPWAFVAIIASGLPRLYGNIKLRKIAYIFADKSQDIDLTVQKEILSIVKRMLPGAIYYSLSGQITIWLISFFGNSTSIAKLGALGRLSMILTIFNVIISTLIVPRFARLSNIKQVLLKRYLQILGLLILLLLILIGVVYTFPDQILWLLGKDYYGLHFELLLSIMGSCIGVIAGVSFSLFAARGWVYHPAIYILINLASILVLSFIVDISTIRGVLILNMVVSFVALLLNTIYCLYSILKIK